MYERAYSLTEASSSDLKSVFPSFSGATILLGLKKSDFIQM
jgi:hypothetical protein